MLNDNPLTMNEKEIDAYLAKAGIDFKLFNSRLATDLAVALRIKGFSPERVNEIIEKLNSPAKPSTNLDLTLRIRVTPQQKEEMEQATKEEGHASLSAFLRWLFINYKKRKQRSKGNEK